ncbi:AAA family ATPase [Bacillus mexicanus]|uniref:AAA family ATPase n=1 Tax=Bacillus mexicanus TaxID=2834415 RepID=UPI003D1986F9
MIKTLKKDVVIVLNEELSKEKGFLYGDDVFVGMDHSKPKTIFSRNDTNRKDILKALYAIELHLNLLGLELKENSNFSEEEIGEKLLEAFNPPHEETDFDLITSGTELAIFPTDRSEEIEEKNDDNQSEHIDFTQTDQNQKPEKQFKEKLGEKISIDLEDTESKKLSREEKRKIVNEGILSALEQGKEKLVDISQVVNKRVEVSDTTIRNNLIDMVDSGKVELAKRGTYRLVKLNEQLVGKDSDINMKFQDQKKSLKDIEVTPTNNVEVVKTDKAILDKRQSNIEDKHQQNTVCRFNKENVEDQKNKITASTYPPLYRDNEAIRHYLEERGVKEMIIKWVLNYRSYNADRFENAAQEIVDRIEEYPVYIGRGVSVLEKTLAAMMRDQPLSLKGEAGTGKTTLVETVSSLLNLPLFSVNGSLESNKATLVGEKDISDKGRLITKDGQMTKAMKCGAILYIDEINMMRPDVLAIVNAATDHRKTFFNDVSKETIVGHKDYRFISAMNVGYAGVKKMNEATMDRTASIVLSYLGKSEIKTLLNEIAKRENEKARLDNSPELGIVDITNLTNIYLKLTSAVMTSGSIPVLAASTRNIILLAKLVPILGYELALEMMLEKFEPEEASVIVGVLSKDDLFEKLNINVANLLQEN